MERKNRSRIVLVVLLLVVALVGTACGSNDPESWDEAGEDGNLYENFQKACNEANVEGGDIELTDAERVAYCKCAFTELLEYYGGVMENGQVADIVGAIEGRDFEAFKDLESDLRSDPEQIPSDIEAMLTGKGGCLEQAS
jgi:hypothetical protein